METPPFDWDTDAAARRVACSGARKAQPQGLRNSH
jgi:hypothetical protein